MLFYLSYATTIILKSHFLNENNKDLSYIRDAVMDIIT